MFFFSSLFFTRFFDHLTLTYLLTTASKLKQSSFKFQELTESERIEDTYNNSEFLLESCDMSLMESSQAVANTEISVLVLAMVNLEVMFLTRTECSLNNSKAKSSRNFVVDPDGNTHCCRSTIFEYFRINYENDKDNGSKDTKIDHNFINCLLTSGSASCCY